MATGGRMIIITITGQVTEMTIRDIPTGITLRIPVRSLAFRLSLHSSRHNPYSSLLSQ
jgi:hypothetical protein